MFPSCLVDLAPTETSSLRNQQNVDDSFQAMVDILYKKTGMSCLLLIGGCDVMDNGEVKQYA